jgi:hypothetical protein
MTGMRAKLAARIAALGAATMGLSACYYDGGVGLGYYDDGYSYYDDGYGCDPYSPFDSYYDCDYRGGFYNIGFGGGWYQDYWYPGYGFYIFDRGGKRYQMYDHHRRYWGGKRHEWYREHHRNRDSHDGRRSHDKERNYSGGRVDDGNRGDHYRNRDSAGNGQNDIWHGDRRRGDGRGDRRRDRMQNGRDAVQQVPPVTAPSVPQAGRGDGQNWRRGGERSAPRIGDGNRRNQQAVPQQQAPQSASPPAAVPQPRAATRAQSDVGGGRGRQTIDRGPREN